MKKFRFLHYFTNYSCKGFHNHDRQRDYCFAAVYHGIRKKVHNTYEIDVFKEPVHDHDNNMCILSQEDLETFVNEVKKYVNCSIEIEEEHDKYVVKVDFKGNNLQNRFLLCWIRYTYEYPFNCFAYDAMKMKKLHKGYSLFNLFNMVSNCTPNTEYGEDIHAIGNLETVQPTSLTTKQIKQKLKNEPNDAYRSEFISTYFDITQDKKYSQISKKDRMNRHFELDYWLDEKEFKKREKIYIKYHLKNKKKYE